MFEVIQNNPVEATVTAIIVVALIVYVFTRKKSQLYDAALYLVTVAENEWGSKMGQIQYAQVMSQIKRQIPIVSVFLPDALLKVIIEKAFKEMKEILKRKQEKEEAEAEEVEKKYLEAKATQK